MKKLILFGGIGLVVLSGLGAGGFIWWKKRAAKHAAEMADPAKVAAEKAAKEAKELEEADKKAGPPAVMVYQKIVNLDRKNAYLKVELHVLIRDPELGKALTSDKATPEASEARALLLELLSGRTLEEVADMETRESVRKEILEKLNEQFAPKHKEGEKEDKKHPKPKNPVKEVLVIDWAISA